jgi:hypothetical protein
MLEREERFEEALATPSPLERGLFARRVPRTGLGEGGRTAQGWRHIHRCDQAPLHAPRHGACWSDCAGGACRTACGVRSLNSALQALQRLQTSFSPLAPVPAG